MWFQLLQTQPKSGSAEARDSEAQDLEAFRVEAEGKMDVSFGKITLVEFFLPDQFPFLPAPFFVYSRRYFDD